MTESEPLFRQEALEHHRSPEDPRGLLDVERPWVSALYWTLLALIVVGLVVVTAVVRVDGRPLFEVLFR